LTGVAKPCDDCALAKSCQKNLKKESFFRSTVPGERLYIDQSYIRQKSYGGREYWLLIVDDCTDLCWSHFLKSRDEQNSFLISMIKDLKAKAQVVVRYIRCDNAGENLALEKLCLLEGLGIQFEYTSPHTPQLNGRVERKFATLYQRCRSMLNGARLNPNLRNGLWAEAACAATDIENVLVSKRKHITSHKAFHNKELPGFQNLHMFGEMAVVNLGKDKTQMKPKHLNKGRHCIYLGRSPNHSQDTYRFLDLTTYGICNSKDVTWLGQPYGTWKGLQVKVKNSF
jgi:hypothetical protein